MISTKIAEAYAEISVKTGPFNRQLNEIRSATEKTTKSIQQKFNALAPTFRKIGIGMTVAGGAITAALGLAVKSSIDFNKEMANIATLIPRSTKRVNELKSAIRTMAVEVGKDTGDLAQGAYQVISAFGDTADTVGILGIAAKAATAGVATTTDSINLLSAVTKGYGDISKEAVQKVSDLAFQAVTLGQTTFPELAASIGKVTPLAASLGVAEEELFAVMATGTGVTGKASEVSTQLRGILQSLMSPTADMAKLIKSMGYESGKAMLQELGLSGSLKAVAKTSEASNEPLQKYISSIEGQTLALALTGAQADAYTEKLGGMRNSMGLTDVAFKEQTEGVNKAGFAFQQAKQQITVLGQEIGDVLLPAIVPLVKNVTELVKKIFSWMKEHKALTGIIVKAVAVVGGLLLVLGPLLVMLPSLISLLPILGIAFHAMLGPIGLITLAITGAVAAFTYFYTTNEKFRNFINNLGAQFKALGENIINWIMWFKDNYFKIWLTIFAGVGTLAKNAAENLLTVFKWLGDSIAKWGAWFGTSFLNVWKNLFSAIQTSIMNFGKNIIAQVGWIWEKIKHPFTEVPRPDWTPLFEDFKAEWGELPKFTELKMKGMAEGIKVYWDEMPGWITPVKKATEELGDTVSAVGDVVTPIINKITGETEELTEAERKLEEQLAKLRGEEYIKALENMIKRAKEQKERTEEQEKALKALQERLEKVRGTEYIRALQNMILRQIEQKERAEEQEEALKKLQERLSELRGEQYIKGLENMISRQIEQKERAEEQEEALRELQEQLEKLRGQEYIRSLEEMIKRGQEQKERTEEQEKELKELQELLKELRGKAYLEALANMIKRAIEQKERTEEQEKALKKLQERLEALRATEYIRALQNMILRQIEQKERAEEQEAALKALQERLAKLRGTEYLRALEEMIKRQKEQKERTEEQEKALRELQERLSELRGQEYIRALQEMIERAKEQKQRTEEQEEALRKLQERLDKLRGDEYIRALKEMIKRQIEMKERTEEQEEAVKSLSETWISAYGSIKSAFVDAVTSIIAGTQSIASALKSLADTVYSTVIKAFVEWAIEAAKAGNKVALAIAGVAVAVKILGIRIRETTTHFETAWGTIGRNFAHTTMEMGENIRGFTDMLETEFNRVGLAISKTIEDAQYKLEGLYQSQIDLQASTREKLITELDKYYDYRTLREMSLDELLALSAETRTKIEQGAIKEVSESEAEQEARRKDQAVSRLQRIEDQYRREDELIRRKIALIEIEIKFLELKMEREAHGHSARARQLEEELDLMLVAYKESVEAYEDAERRKQAATDETRETVEEANEEMRDSTEVAAEAMEDAMRGTAEAIEDAAEDMATAIETATGDMVMAIGVMSNDIVKAVEDMARDIVSAITAMVTQINEKLAEIPDEIKFDIFGILHMPDIPSIGSQYFDIFGSYHAPSIPSYQVGIPYVPRTQVAVIHKKEAVLTAPQAREWRAGKGGGQGGTQVIYERGAIRMTVLGGINQQVDLEEAMDYLAQKQTERLRRL